MSPWKVKRKLKRPAMSLWEAKEARAKEARVKRKYDHVVLQKEHMKKAMQL